MPYNWNEQAGQFRQQGGIRNALRTPTSGLGRLTNALGQALFGPAGGLGANAIFNGIQRGADSRVTPMHGDTGWGFGMTPASTTARSSPISYTVMFFPISPRPPKGRIRVFSSLFIQY